MSTRQHKFQVWDKRYRKMYSEGICIYGDGTFDVRRTAEDGNHIETAESQSGDLILREYTGLRDKEGREVYDGDLGSVSVSIQPSLPLRTALPSSHGKDQAPTRREPTRQEHRGPSYGRSDGSESGRSQPGSGGLGSVGRESTGQEPVSCQAEGYRQERSAQAAMVTMERQRTEEPELSKGLCCSCAFREPLPSSPRTLRFHGGQEH